MSYTDDKFHEFLKHPDYLEIVKSSVHTAQATQLLHFMVNSFGISCYPVFRDTHRSSSDFKIYNLKILYPEREDWDNVATVHPHNSYLEIFTFKDGEAQEPYFINTSNRECKYMNEIVPIEKLLEDIKAIYKLRSKKE